MRQGHRNGPRTAFHEKVPESLSGLALPQLQFLTSGKLEVLKNQIAKQLSLFAFKKQGSRLSCMEILSRRICLLGDREGNEIF